MKKERLKLQLVHIPKHCQQPRSRRGIRRLNPYTDDRLGSMLEFLSYKDDSSSITTASMGQGCHAPILKKKEKMTKFSRVRRSISQDGGRKGLLSNSIEVPFTEIESVAQNALLNTCNNRDIGQHKTDHIDTQSTAGPPFTPEKSTFQVVGREDIWVAPGSGVWAETDNHERRPAEALQKTEHVNFSEHRNKSPDVLKSSIQNDQFDKWNASGSSRTDDDYLERGRGKRSRKPKVHFDDVKFPTKPAKKVRRLRIMRSLGLVAPLGSPFSLASHVRTVFESCRVFGV